MSDASILPLEVVQIIIQYFAEESPKEDVNPFNSADQPRSLLPFVRDLLNLRLVSKVWALAVLPFAHESLCFRSSFMMNTFLKTWNISSDISYTSRLRCLTLDQLGYPNLRIGAHQYSLSLASDCIRPRWPNEDLDYSSELMDDAQRIIRTCAHTLTDLKLTFRKIVGFSPDMIDAIKQVSHLHKLIVVGSPFATDVNDSESLRDLLDATPELRSLSLQFNFLQRLHLKPGSLARLEHLAVTLDLNNIDAITYFCKNQGGNIISLEYLPHRGSTPHSMIFAVQESIQILFMVSLPDLLVSGLCNNYSPYLRVFRTIDSTSPHGDNGWLKLAMFRRMEIFITCYDTSHEYWRDNLTKRKGASLTKAPLFKHIVFITRNGSNLKDPVLAQCFHAHGIACHFRNQFTYAELIDLGRGITQLPANDAPKLLPDGL